MSTGDVLIQVDDDDLYSVNRITNQITPLVLLQADMTALSHDLWLNVEGETLEFLEAVDPAVLVTAHDHRIRHPG